MHFVLRVEADGAFGDSFLLGEFASHCAPCGHCFPVACLDILRVNS